MNCNISPEAQAHACSVARAALAQIIAEPSHLYRSWAMSDHQATHHQGAPALVFTVRALMHKGLVFVALDEGRDLYNITTATQQGETLQSVNGVYCDELAARIDEMIEHPAEMTDAEYFERLKAEGDPLLTWLIEKREKGERVNFIAL